ncbi:D-aminoacyl-tRNA deacylase [Candidatus Micrarchaeota archaeon]|jgi:D-aminoacyl-tRNA deacylase|nr:D-aminoacyl-tRNA deacylase [Candidatus Micrarchaeota archaeon]
MIYLVHATKNIVSDLVCQSLSNISNNIKILESDTNVLDFPKPPSDAERIIVPSTHCSESGKPCFTVHTPGNWTSADLGGNPETLPYADNPLQKTLLNNLIKNNTLGWEVTMEVNHHGPTYDVPITFIEIGSSENQWKNEQALQILSKTIIDTSKTSLPKGVGCFGVGGPHYSPKFTRFEIGEPDFFVGHILPSYKIDTLKYETFVQGIEKTVFKTEKVVFDWKGLKSKQRKTVINFCEEYGINYEKR